MKLNQSNGVRDMKTLSFTKAEINKLQKQYPLGSDFNQKIVVKVFNPYGSQTWYIMNQDPDDPDYLWGVADLGYGIEMGSISLSELTNLRVKPFNMPLERDRYFTQITVNELYEKINSGVHV